MFRFLMARAVETFTPLRWCAHGGGDRLRRAVVGGLLASAASTAIAQPPAGGAQPEPAQDAPMTRTDPANHDAPRTDPAHHDADTQATLDEARAAIERGDFTRAATLLKPHLPPEPAPVHHPPAQLVEIMRRTRLDYALSPADMLARLRQDIPDVTDDDVSEWTRAGVLQHRVIDGQTWYFKRAPVNLLRFSKSAKARWLAARGDKARQPDTWTFPLVEHAATLLRQAKESRAEDSPDGASGDGASRDGEIAPVRHRIKYTLTIPASHPRVRPGAKVRCWLPYPQEYRQLKDVKLLASSPTHAQIAPNATPQRTIYFEQTLTDGDQAVSFMAEYTFVTYAYCPDLDPDKATASDPNDPALRPYLAARPPHIPLDDDVRRLAAQIVGDARNPLERARRMFRWVSEEVRYCAEVEYSTIPSLTHKALATRQGDCGVKAMTFITLCRAAGIPARWQSGWAPLPGDWNMHDWAEFYVAPWGWLPADPSYGLLDHPERAVREFYCGNLDAYRMIVNLDYGRELVPPKTSFRSEPNDFQRGEVEIDGFNLYFDEWDWDFEFDAEPVETSR